MRRGLQFGGAAGFLLLGIACDAPTVPSGLTVPEADPIQYESTEGCVTVEWGDTLCLTGPCESNLPGCNRYGRGSPYEHRFRMVNSCTQREKGINVIYYTNSYGATKADAERWASEGADDNRIYDNFSGKEYDRIQPWHSVLCPGVGQGAFITLCTADSRNREACKSW